MEFVHKFYLVNQYHVVRSFNSDKLCIEASSYKCFAFTSSINLNRKPLTHVSMQMFEKQKKTSINATYISPCVNLRALIYVLIKC